MATEGKSTLSRVLGVIGGILVTIMGVVCFLTPLRTYGITGWLLIVSMIADGLVNIAVWNDYRKAGVSDMWALIGGILSVVLGLVLACSVIGRLAADMFLAYVVAIWIIFGGCTRVMRALAMRKAGKERVEFGSVLGHSWVFTLIMGIVLVALGIFFLANPVILMITIGWQIALAMVAAGIGLIVMTA